MPLVCLRRLLRFDAPLSHLLPVWPGRGGGLCSPAAAVGAHSQVTGGPPRQLPEAPVVAGGLAGLRGTAGPPLIPAAAVSPRPEPSFPEQGWAREWGPGGGPRRAESVSGCCLSPSNPRGLSDSSVKLGAGRAEVSLGGLGGIK